MMKERPILFSGAMVRAILQGQKTQTRRIVPYREHLGHWKGWTPERTDHWARMSPYGQPGDRLWVRETWGDVTLAFQSHENEEPEVIAFRADEGVYNTHSMKRLEKMSDSGIVVAKWKPSIFLPRRFSRLALEITGVRVERLQEITEENAIAEGVNPCDAPVCADRSHPGRHQCAFEDLWDSINGKRASWESNPWVWVVEFKRLRLM